MKIVSNKYYPIYIIFIILLVSTIISSHTIQTDRPVIGIVAHPKYPIDFSYPNRQYIAASYVKWIESGGGRVIPIPYTINRADAEKLFSKVNGIVFPGGSVYYDDASQMLLDVAVNINKNGTYFPIWGTCLGFEWISIYFSNNINILDKSNANDYVDGTTFESYNNIKNTRIIKSMPQYIYNILDDNKRIYNVTMHHHTKGVNINKYNEYLSSQFVLISTNNDLDNIPFISIIEHQYYPVYGTQWHPEKNNYEYGMKYNNENDTIIPYLSTTHSLESIQVSQYFANFFVQEARYNPHSFTTWQEEQAYLIYNYPVTRSGPSYVESYYFDNWT